MARKIRGKKYLYWKHPSGHGWTKARRYKSGKVKIVGVVPASKVPGLKKRKR